MIFFDTETTGIPFGGKVNVAKQPHIIEFGAIKVNDETLEETGRISFLCKPPVLITEEITRITKITNDDLKDQKPFAHYVKDLQDFFLGEKILVAHNVDFDTKMLGIEIRRLDLTINFPWPPKHICTVQKTTHIMGYRMSVSKLYEHCFGKPFIGSHRAIADVEALLACVRHLCAKEEGFLV